MARLFKYGTGTTYNTTTAKYTNNVFTNYSAHNYGSLTAFSQSVDNSMAGNIRDCGECHVGGGGNEYIPNKSPDKRVPLRQVKPGGFLDGLFTAFNYFVDNYNENNHGDGSPAFATFSTLRNDYSKTGVV